MLLCLPLGMGSTFTPQHLFLYSVFCGLYWCFSIHPINSVWVPSLKVVPLIPFVTQLIDNERLEVLMVPKFVTILPKAEIFFIADHQLLEIRQIFLIPKKSYLEKCQTLSFGKTCLKVFCTNILSFWLIRELSFNVLKIRLCCEPVMHWLSYWDSKAEAAQGQVFLAELDRRGDKSRK